MCCASMCPLHPAACGLVCLVCDTSAYLVAYNLASAVGWALILKLVVESWLAGESPAVLYGKAGVLLQVVQTAAALEVVHALLGLVRSPVGTTALQVASRLTLVWAYTVPHAECHAHWSLFLMVGR
jgi:very-long-chain (3R)-3-hydroxyacyl-CoA dehydratase